MRRYVIACLLLSLLPISCNSQPVTLEPTPDAIPSASASFPEVDEPSRYRHLLAPLQPRSPNDETAFLSETLGFRTGPYRVVYDAGQFLIYPQSCAVALSLTLPGGDALNALSEVSVVAQRETESGEQLTLAGRSEWAEFRITLYAYSFHPGLLRWRVEMVRRGKPPSGSQPELQFVDCNTGAEAKGQLEIYAARAPMAAPQLYAYSAALDSTLFYWVDLTSLNPFMEAAHYTPSATPRRIGQRLGHSFSQSDLVNLPQSVAMTIYDSYLYLMPGQPDDEDAMFLRYLHNLGDIYDLMAVPDDPLPDWFGLDEWDGRGVPGASSCIHKATLRDLANEENWVSLNGKRYLRAYVFDSRQSAEAISQLDVYAALSRYQKHFGDLPTYANDLRAAIPDFFNPDFGPEGMFQNSGPLASIGPQERGDTWYELGHALKVAELALWNPGDVELRNLALRSGEAWIDFARTVDYHFPRFYNFGTWEGTGQEPDAAGSYAYLMLTLYDLTGEERYIIESRRSLHSLDGYGFRLTYESHMTAQLAAAAARMYQMEADSYYLDLIARATANLMRLSWLWECDYGWMKGPVGKNPRTFFGLNPTQQSAVITPKEQYEAWIYLSETLQRVHGDLDPTVEKLLAEFVKHTLMTLPWSLPPFLPEGAATTSPSAYETVSRNDLSLFIPLEDLRDGWAMSGIIGQEVYGAGMAPAMAALALVQISPDIVLYGGYPLVASDGPVVTFAGVPGTYTPVTVYGARQVWDDMGKPVAARTCGKALCFRAEGGLTYRLHP